MIAPRRFDHDAARARYQQGESIRTIARSLGVSHQSIFRVVNPNNRLKTRADQKAYWGSARCVDCGNLCSRYLTGIAGPKPNPRCRTCANEQRRRP